MQTVRGMVAVPPGERVTDELLSVAVIPAGTVVVKLMAPLKLPMLVRVTVEEASHEPLATVRFDGLTAIEKSGIGPLLMKTVVSTVSGTGATEPLVIVTHTPPKPLVLEHPVWKVRGVSELVPVTL